MSATSVPLSEARSSNMTLELHNQKTDLRREIALPDGLTWAEAVAYVERRKTADEIVSNAFQYR